MSDVYLTVQKGDIDINVNLLSPRDYSSPFVDVRNYSSFSAAIDSIGASEKTLLIPDEQAVTANKTVPSNVTLMFLQGGSLNISAGKTVTINGHVDAGLYQIFEGAGSVAFGSGSVKEVYPQWWGAKGDGSTDDTGAIQAAIDTQKNVFFANTGDSYLISSCLEYYGDTVIFSNGATIKNAAGRAGAVTMLAPNSTSEENVIIKGITFDQLSGTYGHLADSYCVSVNKVVNAHVVDCVFKNICTMAVWADCADTTKNISIVNNTILSSEAGGFSLFGFIDGIVIANNRIYNCKDDAIALQHSSGVYGDVSSITGNIIVDCHTQNADDSTPNGIHVFGVPNVNITGNTINATYSNNIRVQLPIAISQMNVTISGNVCIEAGKNNVGAVTPACGIYVYSASNTPAHVTILGNSIYSPWSDGITVKNGQFITINANTVKESGLAGIDLDDSKDCIVSNNIIEEAGTRDTNANSIFLIDDSDRNIIIGNRCEGSTNTYYGVAIQANGADNIIAYNNFMGVKTAGISDAGSGNKSHGNISDESADIVSAATITLLSSGEYFNITGTTNITSVTASWAGRRVVLKFAGILTFTDGSNLKLAGNFVTSADDTIALVCDGTNWHEVSRSVN